MGGKNKQRTKGNVRVRARFLPSVTFSENKKPESPQCLLTFAGRLSQLFRKAEGTLLTRFNFDLPSIIYIQI